MSNLYDEMICYLVGFNNIFHYDLKKAKKNTENPFRLEKKKKAFFPVCFNLRPDLNVKSHKKLHFTNLGLATFFQGDWAENTNPRIILSFKNFSGYLFSLLKQLTTQ